jgi:hypothetical protein
MIRRSISIALTLLLALVTSAEPTGKLAGELRPFLSVLDGSTTQFTLTADVDFQIGKEQQSAKLTLSRLGAERFSLSIDHPKYPLIITRNSSRTIFALPAKQLQFVGEGAVAGEDILSPDRALEHLISEDSAASTYSTILQHANAYVAAMTLTELAGLHSDDDGATWIAKALGDGKLTFGQGGAFTLTTKGVTSRVSLLDQANIAKVPEGLAVVKVDRTELERLLVRGVRRATEVAAPGRGLTDPSRIGRVIPHGELRWVGDQRLVLLSGTPQEIGEAHGALLKAEVRHCADSALYLAGLAATVDSGKWFPDQLRGAYAKLETHIPSDHKAETNALADAAGVSREEAHLANVFPELFHCSGFAVFGKATLGGKLYHGRVLDYMTQIGLQDTATVFIMSPNGKIPFANIGYAGFIGSVSGMNARQISLGEMGGRGQGHWDGVPMATLMRRALEECSTLDEVKSLWTTSPRTCEYYYVFSDGKIPSAVGVAATPERCEFLLPGQSHELLGAGIEDAVVLSAGSRLTELRQRVQDGYGAFDAQKAMGLMCRPVAMKSNLHDVLFVPQDGVFYVANADHKSPAAERPYTKYDLAELLAPVARRTASVTGER